MADPVISLIVARGAGGAIGRGNDMPWHVPADFRYFKQQTLGKPIIMGRKTFQSILKRLGKPLPGRHTIVLSRKAFSHDDTPVFAELTQALAVARKWAKLNDADEIMIGGGAEIYKLALPYVQRAYITEIPVHVENADAYFPSLDENWHKKSETAGEGCTFTVWENSTAVKL